MVYLQSGYIEGSYPPLEKRKDFAAAADVFEGLLKAHAYAYKRLHDTAAARHAKVNVGITENIAAFEPLRNWAPLDRITARMVDRAWNWDFLDAIETGELKLTSTDVDRRIDGLKGTQDYVGVNYYQRIYVAGDLLHPDEPKILMHDPNVPGEPLNDLGSQVYPHGFYNILTEAGRRYRKPIYILENGTADHNDNDIARQEFLVEHLREVWLAINQGGVDVRSYVHWSLFDNFEWVEGFDAHFGLVAVDYEHDFKRTARPSAALYAQIAHANAVPETLLRQYLPK
jgi:beta-glucosidase